MAFNEFTTPEIRRVPLNSLLLQMIAMGLKDVRKYFIRNFYFVFFRIFLILYKESF